MILTRSTRLFQPQDAAGIDYANPLSKGLAWLYLPSVEKELVRSLPVTKGSAYSRTKTKGGIGQALTANSTITTTSAQLVSSDTLTMFSVMSVRDVLVAQPGIVIHAGVGAGPAGTTGIGQAPYAGGGGVGAVVYYSPNYNNLVIASSPGGDMVPGSIVVAVATYKRADALRVYANGALRATSAASDFQANLKFNSTVNVGGPGNSSANVLMSGISYRAWSDAEIAEFSANPWQLLKSPPRRIYFDMGAGGGTTTQVSNDLTGEYAIRSAVQCDSSGAYAVLGAVQADASSAYTVLGAVSADVAADYTVRASAQADLAASFTVRGSVQADAASSFTVRDSAQADATATYLLRKSVLRELEASYLIQSATSVMADLVSTYHLRSVVSGTQSSSYPIRSSVSSDKSVVYSLRESALAQNISEFVVRAAVPTSLPTEYLIRASVYASDALSYVIRGPVENDVYSTFVVREGIYRDLAAEYFIELGMSVVFADVTSSYYLDGREVFFAKAQRYVDVPFAKVLAVVPVKRTESFVPP